MSLYRVGVIGGGQMGAGIAALCAFHHRHVVVVDSKNTEQAFLNITHQLREYLEYRSCIDQLDKILSYISVSSEMQSLSTASIVIEAVPESFDTKRTVLEKVSQIVSSSTIIGSNTSAFSILDLSKCVSRPERFMGIHFMNPVLKMNLVELISTDKTSSEIFQTVRSWLLEMQKTTTIAEDTPGFTVNRLLIPMINTAFKLLKSSKVSAVDIDVAMTLGAGFPMGPLRLADMIGLDTCLSIMETLFEQTNIEEYRPADLLNKFVKEGNLGRKTNKGVYDY